MKRTLPVVAVVLTLAVPALAQQGQGQGRGPRPEIPMAGMQAGELDGSRAREAVIQFLELTPEQVTAWDALLETRKALVEPLREELQATEKELLALLQTENPDPAAVGTLVLKAKGLREQIGQGLQLALLPLYARNDKAAGDLDGGAKQHRIQQRRSVCTTVRLPA